MGLLVISLLGAFQTTRDSSPLKGFESLKARALLAYLAVESDRPHARDALAALLWPEFAQEAAHNNLRNTLSNIRRAIGDRDASPPYLFINRETVQFNCDSDVCLDVANLIHQASGLQRPPVRDAQADVQSRIAAVNGYRGPFLEGLSIPDSAAFEEWVSQWRERLERLTLEGLRWLARYYETREDYAAALEFARRQVILEPWMEEGHCQIMRLLALSGLREQALRPLLVDKALAVDARLHGKIKCILIGAPCYAGPESPDRRPRHAQRNVKAMLTHRFPGQALCIGIIDQHVLVGNETVIEDQFAGRADPLAHFILVPAE